MNDTESLQPQAPQKCMNCGSPAVLKEFPNPFCESCRESYIKYPVPLWVKGFAAVIVAILIFSIYKIPRNISLGMHLDKAETAMQDKKYMTSERELKKALNGIPGNQEMQSELMMAAFYNGDFSVYDSMMTIISKQQFDNQDLFGRVQAVVNEAGTMVPGENFNVIYARYKNDYNKIPDTAYENYINANASDVFVRVLYAEMLSNKKKYTASDSLLTGVLVQDMEYVPALEGIASNKRVESSPDSSFYYCDRLLNINKENVYAISSKARTYLSIKKDAEGMALAQQASALDRTDYYTMETLALAYHFANNTRARDDMMREISALHDSSVDESLQYVRDVISGKEKFRN